jgi:hypothetical protein
MEMVIGVTAGSRLNKCLPLFLLHASAALLAIARHMVHS